MVTRPKFARMANYSCECVEASHIFLKNGLWRIVGESGEYSVNGSANVGESGEYSVNGLANVSESGESSVNCLANVGESGESYKYVST
jgi:hypothetical protein